MSQPFYLWPDHRRAPVQANLIGYIQRLAADKAHLITVEPYKETRSKKQNRTLHRAYGIIGQALGYDRSDQEDLHETMLCDHFGYTVRVILGHERRIPNRRSHNLKTDEFAQFYEFIVRKAAEFGVTVPEPDPTKGQCQ